MEWREREKRTVPVPKNILKRKIVWMFHFLDCAALPVPGLLFVACALFAGFVAVALFFFADSAILGVQLLLSCIFQILTALPGVRDDMKIPRLHPFEGIIRVDFWCSRKFPSPRILLGP